MFIVDLSTNQKRKFSFIKIDFQETTQHDLAGYIKGKGNTKLALLRNAGHSAPMDQPQWTLRLIESFVNESRS